MVSGAPALSIFNRRRKHILDRHRAALVDRFQPAIWRARHDRRLAADVDRLERQFLDIDLGRGDARIVEHGRFTAGRVNDHVSPTAESRHIWFNDIERRRGRYGSIDGIATLLQDA